MKQTEKSRLLYKFSYVICIKITPGYNCKTLLYRSIDHVSMLQTSQSSFILVLAVFNNENFSVRAIL